MNKVLRLIRVQLWAVLGDMLMLGNNRKRKPKSLYAGVVLFVLGMSAISFFYCFMIGKGLMMFDSIELLPALFMAATSLIVLLTTVFKVKGTIFGFRDYDMVMSLPVKTSSIVASRLILLYSINFVFVLMLMLPMMIAYGILAKPEVMFYVFSLLTIWFIPLVPIIIASVFGTLITYVSSKFRHSNLVSIVVSLVALIAFIGLSATMGDSGEELVNISKALTEQVNSTYLLAAMYTEAVINYDVIALLSFLGISLAAFLLYSLLIGKVFKKINTIIMTGKYRINFKLGELKTSSPLKALYHKELRRFFSSTLYVLNTGVGIVMLTIGAIALLFVDLEQIVGNPQMFEMLVKGSPVFVTFCLATSCTTMASISLEGKHLWIIKSLPVSPRDIFHSKLAVNFTLTAPAIIDVIIISIILKLSILQGILMLLVTVSCAVFVSLFGLLVNLKLPNFNWTNEAVVIKQSASSIIVVFSSFGIVGLQVLFLVLFQSFELTYLIYSVLIILMDLYLYRVLMNYGPKRFAKL